MIQVNIARPKIRGTAGISRDSSSHLCSVMPRFNQPAALTQPSGLKADGRGAAGTMLLSPALAPTGER